MENFDGWRVCAVAVAIAGSLVGLSGVVCAYDSDVIANCTSDYFAYCSQYDPDSDKTRDCMEEHRNQLSKQCVRALVDAGEVPDKYLGKDDKK